ncbi:hypothetical protein DXG01_005973 [Tephrocybe rancida]|nr:hypothetical protein DXG01_005973 [Tephrocybe rancida]
MVSYVIVYHFRFYLFSTSRRPQVQPNLLGLRTLTPVQYQYEVYWRAYPAPLIVTSRMGHLRFTFNSNETLDVILELTWPSVLISTPTNVSFPHGTVALHLRHGSSQVHEICGSNSELQDSIITPTSTLPHVQAFNGYYCARFDSGSDSTSYGTVQNSTTIPEALSGEGAQLAGYAVFAPRSVMNFRVGTSFVSIDQGRRNIDAEIPDGMSLERTFRTTKT